ncbi:cerebellar degeneration-related protein 2-like isoform X2 [Sitophilus oryzae]|uniref:Cerebellar degeneration-related protein 2-like isoform X2 n=1 Tax=Sitophilus oryzae TaxID=7048 RepID=A0A6J2XPH4_SITOR|nr:cerebellar degeneration-related protein 2-like isoform X2 [Sitophilus oryzae]
MSASKAQGGLPKGEIARSRMLEDLHLAAELGKTLLDRNKELEAFLKEKQTTIEDQKLEIEYLTKQTVALKEVNDSRLRIYEQLEVSIQDLERTNHRLQFENSSEKKHIKSLNATVEQLEGKCEELQSTIDDLRIQVDILRKKAARNSDIGLPKSATPKEVVTLRHVHGRPEDDYPTSPDLSPAVHTDQVNCTSPPRPDTRQSGDPPSLTPTDPECDQTNSDETDNGMEEIAQLLAQLRETRAQCSKDERIIAELEEQLSTMVRQNQALENQVIQLSHRGDDLNMKSMHEELTTLDEVRQGQMCSKCLRGLDQTDSELAEEDDQSMLDELMTPQHRTSFSLNVQDHANNQSSPLPVQPAANPYKVLVEKYEALVEVHRNPVRANKHEEETQMSGDFSHPTGAKDTDEESGHDGSLRTAGQRKQARKLFSTPTDFSEAETSSSGFADETSNKGTQTEGRVGSFLCTIADGEDCKFSIYDDASPLDSRFRDRPEYRDLFKEIFRVLKKAAENKAEGDELPLLDDAAKTATAAPPATPMNEQQMPEFLDDDSQSVMSSTMSELSTQNEPAGIIENIIQAQNQPIPEVESASCSLPTKQECILKPLVRQPLEYLSVEVRKRSSSRRKNKQHVDRSDSPVTHIIGSPKITYSSRPNSGRKRQTPKQNAPADENAWNGNTLQFWATNRNVACPSPTPSQGSSKGYFEFKPSLASQDLHKLKKLDLSYAEVLRNADNKKRELYRQRRK